MFTEVRNKWFGWLAALALWPVVGVGQVIIEHPQDMTVCVGKETMFTTASKEGTTNWYIDNDLLIGDMSEVSEEKKVLIHSVGSFSDGVTTQTLTITYNEIIKSGLKVQLTIEGVDGLVVNSTAAYLSYEPNHQSPATDLLATVSNGTARFCWNELESNFTTQYLFGVYDDNDNLIANQTTDTTQISYELPYTCQYLTFRVTADLCPDPDNSFNQTESAALAFTSPNVSPVTAEFDNNQTVLVNWTPDGNSTYWITFTDPDRHDMVQTFDDAPPFSYTPACGQYRLNVSVSPAQCAGEPDFTHHASVSFTIPCPITPTIATDTASGTGAIYPSVLLTVAAIIPLLKWQH